MIRSDSLVDAYSAARRMAGKTGDLKADGLKANDVKADDLEARERVRHMIVA
jgi:hypothetical protein